MSTHNTHSDTAPSTRTAEPAAEVRNARLVAWNATAADRANADPHAIGPYGLDAVYAASQATGTARRVAFLRSQLAQLVTYDVRCLDTLPTRADALLHGQSLVVGRADRSTLLVQHAAQGTQLRALFFTYGDVLVLKGELDADLQAKLREGSGYRDLVEDLATYVHLFSAHPQWVRAGAPVTATELDAASQLVSQLELDLGERSDPDQELAALLEERRRAAGLLVFDYEETRAAVLFLRRREGDGDKLAPSLYVPRGPAAKNAALPTAAPAATGAAPAATPSSDAAFAAMNAGPATMPAAGTVPDPFGRT